jgi:hypothetical protein
MTLDVNQTEVPNHSADTRQQQDEADNAPDDSAAR